VKTLSLQNRNKTW